MLNIILAFFTEGFWFLLPLILAGVGCLIYALWLLRKLVDPKVKPEDRPSKGKIVKYALLASAALLVYMVVLAWPMGLYNTLGRSTLMDIKLWIPILCLPFLYIVFFFIKADATKQIVNWLYISTSFLAVIYLTLPGLVISSEESYYRTMAQDTDVSLTVGVYGKHLNMPEQFPEAEWPTGENWRENWVLKSSDSYEWIAVFKFGFSNKVRVYELPDPPDKPRVYEVDGKHYVFCVDGDRQPKGLVIEMPTEVAEHIIRCGLDPQPDPPKEKPKLP